MIAGEVLQAGAAELGDGADWERVLCGGLRARSGQSASRRRVRLPWAVPVSGAGRRQSAVENRHGQLLTAQPPPS